MQSVNRLSEPPPFRAAASRRECEGGAHHRCGRAGGGRRGGRGGPQRRRVGHAEDGRCERAHVDAPLEHEDGGTLRLPQRLPPRRSRSDVSKYLRDGQRSLGLACGSGGRRLGAAML